MTVRRVDATTIVLEEVCPIEDAERLIRHLLESPGAAVDWRDCDHMHAAVLQVLLLGRPALVGLPRGTFLAQYIARPLAIMSRT